MENTIPNLWGVIRPDDISQKGNGNFKADYMNWALTSHLMHEHAPGWDFELVEWNDQSGQPQSVYKAPDGISLRCRSLVPHRYRHPDSEVSSSVHGPPEQPGALRARERPCIDGYRTSVSLHVCCCCVSVWRVSSGHGWLLRIRMRMMTSPPRLPSLSQGPKYLRTRKTR